MEGREKGFFSVCVIEIFTWEYYRIKNQKKRYDQRLFAGYCENFASNINLEKIGIDIFMVFVVKDLKFLMVFFIY